MIQQPNEYQADSSAIRPRIDIEKLVETKLPPSPGNLMRLNSLLRDYNSSIRQIIEAISYEPPLVVRILRLTNSAIYALENSVTSIQTAINVIGNQTLQDIIMIEFASATFGKHIRYSIYGQKIWEHSLTVAILSRELSKSLEMQGTEEAFTCGLLHDLGKLILLSSDFENYSKILSAGEESEMLADETRRYGYNHAEIGSLVARRWDLPEGVRYSIMNHHNPSQAEQPMLVTHIIDVADLVANIKGYGIRIEDEARLTYSESAMKLGFTPEHLENIWKRVKPNIEEIIKTYN